LSSVTALTVPTWRLALVAVTLTPGSTAPLSSVTTPMMLAWAAVWLNAGETDDRKTATTQKRAWQRERRRNSAKLAAMTLPSFAPAPIRSVAG
jgi:hypothetical protein